jgi:hypothetical protein
MTLRQLMLARRWSERIRRAVYILQRGRSVVIETQAQHGDEMLMIVCGPEVVW